MTRPHSFQDTLPAQSRLKRLEVALRSGASAKIRRRGADARLVPGPWGACAPTRAQSALIGAARAMPAFHSALRNQVSLWLDTLRPGPLDAEVHGCRIRFYPMLAASFRHMLLTPKVYQADELAFFAAHATGPGAFVDIGANCGVYTFWAAGRDRARTVIAFEPHETFAAILAANAAMADRPAVRVVRAAAGAEDGTAQFSPSEQSVAYGEDAVTVPCRSLLSVLREAGATAVAGLKLDAEGVEDAILVPFFADAPAALWPRSIVIEHAASHLWRTDALALLADRGYREVFRNKLNSGFARDGAPPVSAEGA
jgi:FkbM family methyltransferase